MHQYSADKRSANNDTFVQKLTKALLIYTITSFDKSLEINARDEKVTRYRELAANAQGRHESR